VDAHGAMVGAADAAKELSVACSRRGVDVLILARGIPYNLNQSRRNRGAGMLVVLCPGMDERHWEDQAGDQR